jgi:glycosyltransferase involved in cell wall biosynthesis
MTSQKPHISVIVPVRNAEQQLPALIEAMAAQDYPAKKRELILVDNGSTDGTVGIIRQAAGQGVRGIGEPAVGSYYARNAGVRVATGSILAFTDADCIPEPDWVSQGVQCMETGGIELLTGRVIQEVGGGANLFQTIDRMVYLRQDWYRTQGFGATANLFIRREAFEALGGFDARLCSSGDRMLGYLAGRRGFRFGYHEAAVVHHTPRATALAIALKELRLGQGFGQIWRFYPKRDGLRLLGQTSSAITSFRGRPDRSAIDIPPGRAVLALVVYGLIHVPCRTFGFLKGVCRPGKNE